ncbi:MAG: hypothetical protein BHW64_06745 [Candidatus Melainabacteria bacterium LEY3_CP_29_8]|nr:MAG: hypothetical protein BHW64_06745 [Candidatus Melainabacteria bacterium LEY3_CP_29_8]
MGSAAIAAAAAAVIFGIKYSKLNKSTKEIVESTKEKLQKDFNVIKEGSATILKHAGQDQEKLNKLSDEEISGLFKAKGVKILNLPKLEKVGENFALSDVEENASNAEKKQGVLDNVVSVAKNARQYQIV